LTDAQETVQVSYQSIYGNTGSQSRHLALDLSAPVFTSSTSATVDENVAAGTLVYTAQATDGRAITYALKAGQGDAALFTINASTGAVTLTGSPNFEVKSAYSFTVQATDASGNVSERTVALSVNNLNEAPTALALSTTSVAENLAAGALVATLSATDPDDTNSGFSVPYSFSLVSGTGSTDNAAFDVVGNELRLRASANFESQSSYSVRLRATDAAGLWFERSETITVVNVPEVTSAALSASGAQNSRLNADDTLSVTLSFDMAVTVVTTGGVPTVTLDVGGTPVQASYVSGSGTSSLVFSATIASPMNDGNGVALVANSLALNGGTIRNGSLDATLTHSGLSDNASFIVDTTAPTVAITDNVADTVANGPVTFTFTFSENVTGFTADDVTVSANGTKGVFTAVSDSVYTLVVTPDAGSTGTLEVSVGAGLATDAAGNNNLASATAQQVFDTQAPSVAITLSDTALKVGDTSLVTFTFSEAVTGFSNADISAANGTLSTVSSSDGGTTWTATFTPSTQTEDATNVITVAAGSYTDQAGNAGLAGSSANYTVDTTPPVAPNAVLSSDTSNGGAGFDNDSVTSSGAITAPTNTEGGATLEYRVRLGTGAFSAWDTTYTAPATNGSADGSYTVELRQTDAAGNTGATQTLSYTLDSTGPVAPNVALASDTGNGTAGASSDGRTRSGAVTAPTNIESGAVLQYRVQKDGAAFSAWTGSYTAPVTDGSADGSYVVEARQIDRAGNVGATQTVSFTLDNSAPAQPNAALTTDSGAGGDNITNAGGITAPTNTEPGAVLEYRVRLGGGAFSAWSTSYTAPLINGTADGAYTVEVRQTDVAGNVSASQTINFTLDTQGPTLTSIALADSALRIGETSLVTFTFSEAVTGFANADITVQNGTLSAVASSDGGITWTATFTPTSNITDRRFFICFAL
jgi:large repetitive protein